MITLADIQEARERIREIALLTPVIQDLYSPLRIKAEHLQRTNSFKLRGAANAVSQAVAAGAGHVVTGSSGNHGQAVAYIARQLGIRATIVVPEDCQPAKMRGMERWGARVEFGGLTSTARLARAAEITEQEGAVFIAPYDDPRVMAGQGTVGLELLEQVADLEVVYVPVGGGGLISGVATAIKESRPGVRIIGVEPELANDTYLSLQAGRIIAVDATQTVADGLRTAQPGNLTFPVIQRYVDEIVTVSEEEIRQARRYLLEQMKQVVEPSGAVSVAAALRSGAGRAVAVVSGGNADL